MKKFTLVAALFCCIVSVYAINPVREYNLTPEKAGLDYEEIKVSTPDGYQLNTWLMHPAEVDKKPLTLVIAYGDGGNMGFMMGYAMGLVRSGYTVITFDYRGFGHSDDFEINKDCYYYNEFATDLESVLKWAKSKKGEDKLGVMAFSMGTAMATLAYQKESFDFLIGEGVVYDPIENIKRIKVLKNKDLILPQKAKKLKRKVLKLEVPVLYFAAQKDEVTTREDTYKIARSLDNCKVVEYDGDHLMGAATLGLGEYFRIIVSWLEKLDE